VWFTGLPASGKSTIAYAVEKALCSYGVHSYVLDGDNVRIGLNSDLGFGDWDRRENLRRVAEVAWLMADSGLIVLASFVSPYAKDRQSVRNRLSDMPFLEVYVKCSTEECRRRDPKGHYQAAQEGRIARFTGVSSPYEAPEKPDLILDTERMPVGECVETVINSLKIRLS
jgi:adenylylsulfate kinase